MEKLISAEVVDDSCPEAILFKTICELNERFFAYYQEKKEEITGKDPELKKTLKENLKLAKKLAKLGIEKTTDIEKGRECLSPVFFNWYSGWFSMYRDLSDKEKQIFMNDIQIWETDHNHDLSRWQPKTS